MDRHCYKCDSYRPVVGGSVLLDGRGRRRFVCAHCRALSVPATRIAAKVPSAA